jgi:tRNA dimethylallyltransferase
MTCWPRLQPSDQMVNLRYTRVALSVARTTRAAGRDLREPAEATKPVAVFLMGPTASGKTGLAVDLVQRLPCDIVSVDSAQVFRDLDIGTSKPSKAVQAVAPHRLIDVLDAAEAYSAARFRLEALHEMNEITGRGRIPLLVGGTMLYFRALQRGMARLPTADPQIRSRLSATARRHGWPALHAELGRVDPPSAQRIHPSDAQRIQRALEVYELTGRGLSELFSEQEAESFPYKVLKFVLAPHDPIALAERVAVRFREMLAQGLVEEVASLRDRRDLDLAKPAMRAVGYRQVWQYLDGEHNYQEMTERAIIATRQLAKRQMTWLRAEQGTTSLDSSDPRPVIERLRRVIT